MWLKLQDGKHSFLQSLQIATESLRRDILDALGRASSLLGKISSLPVMQVSFLILEGLA